MTAIARASIQAARPRTCIMPLLFAIGLQMHRKYGLAEGVHELAHCGFSMSLDEVTQFLQSVMTSFHGWHTEDVQNASFTQFIADNVDHNVRTVDGHSTFAGLGMISASCFGSGTEAVQQRRIKRSKKRLTMREACLEKGIPILQFNGKAGAGLQEYFLKPLDIQHGHVCN